MPRRVGGRCRRAPVGGIPATLCGSRRTAAGRASLMADSLRPTAPAWWPPARIVRSPPPVRSCGVVAPLPPGPPATSPAAAPGCDPKADARVVGAGAPLHPGAARLAGRHPGRPADLPLVSPHSTLPRRLGTRATRHAQYRLACDRPSLPVTPAPLGRRSRPFAPPWQGGSRHHGRTTGVGPPLAPLESKQQQPTPRQSPPRTPSSNCVTDPPRSRPTPLASGRPLGIIR